LTEESKAMFASASPRRNLLRAVGGTAAAICAGRCGGAAPTPHRQAGRSKAAEAPAEGRRRRGEASTTPLSRPPRRSTRPATSPRPAARDRPADDGAVQAAAGQTVVRLDEPQRRAYQKFMEEWIKASSEELEIKIQNEPIPNDWDQS